MSSSITFPESYLEDEGIETAFQDRELFVEHGDSSKVDTSS
ncbi:hypothetical protein OB919_15080 [Halobacteria archaeon AArc-curdl1]|uniref:Uncharacterized protein n=1 Tax=Natronosalvus hydrolyticus TaxID=2979988 RepID=A0AAP2Z9Q2_9EURY|nr:hypothetical protein [Halobacteria archaeon AArc-curdl1]